MTLGAGPTQSHETFKYLTWVFLFDVSLYSSKFVVLFYYVGINFY